MEKKLISLYNNLYKSGPKAQLRTSVKHNVSQHIIFHSNKKCGMDNKTGDQPEY